MKTVASRRIPLKSTFRDAPLINRGAARFGPPENVIRDHPGWGIAEFKADDMPPTVTRPDPKKLGQTVSYDFVPTHVRRDDNPAHSEIRIHKNGKYNKYRMLPPDHAAYLAYLLSERARLIRPPDV